MIFTSYGHVNLYTKPRRLPDLNKVALIWKDSFESDSYYQEEKGYRSTWSDNMSTLKWKPFLQIEEKRNIWE